jgi:hypothetical protein
MCGDSGVPFPAVVFPDFLKRFKSGYLDPSFRGALGMRSGSGSGSASCPGDLGLREPEGREQTGRCRCAVERAVWLISRRLR